MPDTGPTERQPRLAMVVNDPAFLLSHRIEIATGARDAGFEVHIVTPTAPSAAVETIRSLGFAHHPVRMPRGRIAPGADLATIGALYRLFRRLAPDLVHLVTIKPVLYGGVAARLARVPAAASAISGLGYLFISESAKARALRTALAPLYRMALNRPGQRIIFQNQADRASLAGLGVGVEGRAVLIPGSGVDLAAYDADRPPDDPPIVVMPARMLIDKGAREFVAAAARLRAGGLRARFVYLGEPDPANPASIGAAELARWQRAGDVEFWGHHRNMPVILGRAALVVLPSYREGMPKALLEAAAAGRTVVTTDVPGCRDAIEPGETGVLVPARNAGALASAIADLIGDPERRRAMGRAGRRLAERAFAVEDVVARHLALYRDLVAEPASR